MDIEKLKKFLQDHDEIYLLAGLERLTGEDREKMIKQIDKIDFDEMDRLFKLTQKFEEKSDDVIEPMRHEDITTLDEETKRSYIAMGEQIIKSGKYAVVTMAGGQGTRLGHNGPKGTFDMGLPSHKSLFEIFADKLKVAKEKYNTNINWYIMTSNENNDATKSFFESHNYFENDKSLVSKFFIQNELPMLTEDGKILVGEDGFVKEAANGHGGVFDAMFENGVLDDMKEKGIEWVFICGVDNPLVNMVDPLFIGFTASHGYIAASKTLPKISPEEKVGAFCMKNGRPYVMEYTEISSELANMKDVNGELIYGESHVLLNIFNIKALDLIKEVKLPYHVAHKKSSYIDEEGKLVESSKPNAYKFETFLFDAFSILPNLGLIRGIREKDFAPIKNAIGEDSPETARKLFIENQY